MKTASLNDVDQEIRMVEFSLRYVELMRDAHSSLEDEDINSLIKESKFI